MVGVEWSMLNNCVGARRSVRRQLRTAACEGVFVLALAAPVSQLPRCVSPLPRPGRRAGAAALPARRPRYARPALRCLRACTSSGLQRCARLVAWPCCGEGGRRGILSQFAITSGLLCAPGGPVARCVVLALSVGWSGCTAGAGQSVEGPAVRLCTSWGACTAAASMGPRCWAGFLTARHAAWPCMS